MSRIAMAQSRNSALDMLGRKHRTDKASHGHDYLRFYERFFDQRRLEKLKILEIGVLNGASLKVWEEYFEHSEIVGADILPEKLRYETARTRVAILDQSNVEQLVALGMRHGPFDIIIEDGSHIWGHQILTLQMLFPFLKPGGIYVVEDLETSYGPFIEDYRGTASQSCVEYLKRWLDLCVSEGYTDLAAIEDGFLRTYGFEVAHMTFAKHCCLIEKRLARRDRSAFRPGMVVIDETRTGPMPRVYVHIGGIGDVGTEGGIVCDDADPQQNIQSFVLYLDKEEAPELAYRARLADGSWTAFAGAGERVGTIGQSQDLTGLEVTFGEAFRKHNQIRVLAAFRGIPGVVEVSAGQACVPPVGLPALYGIQIVIDPIRAGG